MTRLAAFFSRNGLVILFLLLSYGLYHQAILKKEREKKRLEEDFVALIEKRDEALSMQEALSARIESQDDPDWIELRLKERLGLVPEDQIKVYIR